VLFLVPEAFLPLRTAGSRFHASVEGLTALDHAFTTLADPPADPPATAVERTGPPDAVPPGPVPTGPVPTGPVPTDPVPTDPVIESQDVTVAFPRGVALHRFSLRIAPGTKLAVIGPSGAGKSTLLHLLLGFVTPTE